MLRRSLNRLLSCPQLGRTQHQSPFCRAGWSRALAWAALLCGLTGTVMAEDWPQYRGVAGDGKSSETIASEPWTGKPRVAWKVDTPLGFSSFTVAGGMAFTLVTRDHQGQPTETCVALDAATGKEVWSYPLGVAEYEHGGGNAGTPDNNGGDGPRSTPTVYGRHVYVYDAHLLLVCLRADDGHLVWKQDIAADFAGRNIKWKNATSPLLHEDVVFVGGGGPGQSLLAFDSATGRNLWKAGDQLITHATPTVATLNGSRQIIFFTQSGLTSVDPTTGDELWSTDFEFRVSTAASPVVEDNHVYCSAGYSVGAGLFEIQPQNQVRRVWLKKNKLMNHWSTPIVLDGHLYGIFEFKKYGRAPLQCVELATGEIKWSERNFGPGNCILVGDKLVVLSDAGEVVIVAAQPDQYRELGRAKLLEGKCWSTPAFSDGKIFVRSTTEGACIALD